MSATAAKVTINVWERRHEVTVYQRSDGRWMAVGDHLGHRLEVEGSTEKLAVGFWRAAAKYSGTGASD